MTQVLSVTYRPEDGDYTTAPDLWRKSTHAQLDLPESPTAINTANDTVTAVVLERVRQEGADVPGEISIIGIDDQPSLAFLDLTTVKLPVIDVSRQATALLIKRIADWHADMMHVTLPCPLMQRGTTGPPRGALKKRAGYFAGAARSARAQANCTLEGRVGKTEHRRFSLRKQEGEA